MRQLITVLAACGLIGAFMPIMPACDGGDGDGDGDTDGDGDADCDPEGTVCEDDFDCCQGLACACDGPTCPPSDFLCTVCQPLGEGCNTSLECCRDGVCAGHTCVSVFDRDYEVQIVFDEIYARNDRAGGNYWDPQDCDATDSCTAAEELERSPDPYVVVTIGDTTHTTATHQNELSTAWVEETFIAPIAYRTPYTTYIYDEDGAEDAVVLDWGHEVEPTLGWTILARTLRMGGMSIPEPTASPTQNTELRLMFVPQQ